MASNGAATVSRRLKYMSPTYAMFQTFKNPLVISRASMQYMYDPEGRRYLDLLANNLTISVGHNHPKVTAAVSAQLGRAAHTSTMYYSEQAATLAEKLVNTMPARKDGIPWQVLFAVSGTEAVELAAHMARVYTGTTNLISLQNSYHGSYGTAMGISGISGCKHPFPETGNIFHIPPPLSPPYNVDDLIAQGEKIINGSASNKLAGIFLEPVQGYGGIYVLPRDYMNKAAALAQKYGGLVIADEIQSGMSRMGDVFWSYQMSDIEPDMIVVAKGLGNGLPVSAVVARADIFAKVVESGKWVFSTYGANPVVCAGANAVMDIVTAPGWKENVMRQSKKVETTLLKLQKDFSAEVKEVRGHGLMFGMEVDPQVAARVFETLKDNGVLMGLGGVKKNVLRVMPPMCLTDDDIDLLDHLFRQTMKKL